MAAWQEQLARASKHPFLLKLLLQQWQTVLQRLAYYYAQLASMPRRHRRALQRTLATSLLGAAILLSLTNAPFVHAATITVSGACTLDEAIVNANDDAATYADCAAGSGVDTIVLTDNITLTGPLSAVASEIILEGNNFYVSGDDLYRVFTVASTGNFTINETTVRNGDHYDAGGGVYNDGGVLEINDSTLTDNYAFAGGAIFNYRGTLTINNTTISGNYAAYGSALINEYGEATLTNATITGNEFPCGCAEYGGTIINSPDSTLSIYDSTITENNGGFAGGGIVNGGELLVVNTTISGNQAYLGGGILAAGGTASIFNSTISGNYSLSGAGILNAYGTVDVNSTTISGNYAYIGAGISNLAILRGMASHPESNFGKASRERAASGSALSSRLAEKFPNVSPDTLPTKENLRAIASKRFSKKIKPQQAPALFDCEEDCPPAVTTIANSTVSGNEALFSGGGIAVSYYGEISLYNVTVTGNTAEDIGGGVAVYDDGAVTLQRTIVSGNSAYEYNEIAVSPYGGTITTNSYNLFGQSGETNAQAFVGFTPGATDLTATSDGNTPTALASILNTTLNTNGGPTQTHALLFGSPAVDKGPNAACIADPISYVDQRGFSRNIDINNGNPNFLCDIGAYELQLTTAVNVTNVQGRLNPQGKAIITWRTTTESQIAGFNIYRKRANSNWKKINSNFKQAKHAGTVQGAKYKFTNRTIKPGKTYRYKVEVHYLDGHTEWTEIVRVDTR